MSGMSKEGVSRSQVRRRRQVAHQKILSTECSRPERLPILMKILMTKVLLTGIPGTGKTAMGDYFATKRSFEHFDIEEFLKAPPPKTVNDILSTISNTTTSHQNVVVTWGFMPTQDIPTIRYIQSIGFNMIWLGGNDRAAYREYTKRNLVNKMTRSVSDRNWSVQMHNIGLMNLKQFGAHQINPFTKRGKFRSKEAIARDVLA